MSYQILDLRNEPITVNIPGEESTYTVCTWDLSSHKDLYDILEGCTVPVLLENIRLTWTDGGETFLKDIPARYTVFGESTSETFGNEYVSVPTISKDTDLLRLHISEPYQDSGKYYLHIYALKNE